MSAIRLSPRQFLALTHGERSGKMGARRSEYNGVMYHSAAEARYAAELDLRKQVGDILDWQRQVAFPLSVNGIQVAKFVVDFSVIHKNGDTEYVELKGFETQLYLLKLKLFRAIYPGVKLTVQKV